MHSNNIQFHSFDAHTTKDVSAQIFAYLEFEEKAGEDTGGRIGEANLSFPGWHSGCTKERKVPIYGDGGQYETSHQRNRS